MTTQIPVPAAPTSQPDAPVHDERWVRPALLGLLAGTALLYLWGLAASGWANAYYAAAAQAGSQSWTAWFFGASDAAGSITVDKTPLSVWVMALSMRVFGVNSWSLLLPQALMGVAAVALLHATVRRWAGPVAGLLAAAVLALTPVAVLMFRFDNPDALLVLLLVAGAWATTRAVERASTRWLVLAGVLVGLGFMTKMLQALLVVPAFALVHLVAAPAPLRRRLLQLLAAFAGMLVAGGWWVAVVELLPPSARPYVGGSQTNSVLELTLGYNGLGRLTGEEVGSVGGGGGWGETGWDRLVNAEIGGQVAWLLPAAIVSAAVLLWATRGAPRTDRTRAAVVLWGGWLLVTAAVFSFMGGIFHAYYTVALAPAIGALVGTAAVWLWRSDAAWARPILAIMVAWSAVWAAILLGRTPDFVPQLRALVVVAGVLGAALLAVPAAGRPGARGRRGLRRVAAAGVALGLVGVLAGPAAYAVQTAATPHAGAIPSAGPQVAGAFGPGGGGARVFPGRRGAPGGLPAPGTRGGVTPAPAPGAAAGTVGGAPGAAPGRGGPGGLLDAADVSTQLRGVLAQNASSYTWVAATIGSNRAAGFQLATGSPVMAIGGFNGSDPSPTLTRFQEYVRQGRIHWFVGDAAGGAGGPGMRAMGGSDAAREIAAWVQRTFPARTVDGVTLYDLTAGTGASA